jgi:hypothetical protein
MLGRCAASQIASASIASFLPLYERLHISRGISLMAKRVS